MSHRAPFVIILVLLFSGLASAQEPATPLRSADDSEAAATRKKAIDLLQTVAGQVNTLRSAENRARIGSNAAEALWEHDEKRARSLFAAVEENIKAGLGDTDPDEASRGNTRRVFWQLRSDTLVRIAKHDPALALEFLQATRLSTQPDEELSDSEKSLELGLASQIAAKDPQLALKLFRQSLAKGFSNDVVPLISQLKRKDKETSQAVLKEIVDKLKSADPEQDPEATELAANLVRSFPPPDGDDQVYRDLLGMLLASAIRNGCAEEPGRAVSICYQVGSVFSKIERYYGSRAAPIKRWGEVWQNPDEPSAEMWASYREVMEKGTVDEVLALAPNFGGMQSQIFQSAMGKALDSGDFVRARKIAADFPDEEQRQELVAEIDRYRDFSSMNADNKLAVIQKELSNFRNKDERLMALLYMSNQAVRKDRKLALIMLDQVGQILDSTKSGKTQLEGQIAMATIYCSLRNERGFAIMQSLMPRLNELVTASAVLDGFENNYLRDGEWNMSGAGSVGGLLTRLWQNVGYFAALDFDRSLALARQMERQELRLMAELKIAQSVLSGQPLPSLFQYYPRY